MRFDINTTDKEQIEMLKRFWNDYGKALLTAIIVGLAIGYGWRYWQNYRTEKRAEASVAYQSLLIANQANDTKALTHAATQLKKDFAKSPYASLAAMLMAKVDVDAQQYAKAVAELEWVRTKSGNDFFAMLASLREARIQLALNKPQQALSLLKRQNLGTFAPAYAIVEAQAYLALGQTKLAHSAYQAAQQGFAKLNISDPNVALLSEALS